MTNDYQYAFKRLKKLEKTLTQLIEQNRALAETNRQLHAQHDTDLRREAARERVLQSFQAQEESRSGDYSLREGEQA